MVCDLWRGTSYPVAVVPINLLYLCVFCCASTRAAYLEKAVDTLRREVSRDQLPIWSIRSTGAARSDAVDPKGASDIPTRSAR